jgi:UDP-N-acetylmuramate--alanine ligase
MVAAGLVAAGYDPTIVIGGRLGILGGSNARLGQGEWLVAEADESDGSFLLLSPTMALLTNIDAEHLDHYGTVEALEGAFLQFVNKVPFYGAAVMCLDHPVVQRLIPSVRRRVITYGLSRNADVRAASVQAQGLTSTFKVQQGDAVLGEVRLGMPGLHNVVNAVGAVALALDMGIAFADIQRALDGFGGVQRRFTVRGEVSGVMVVDDYGHHPVEVDATLKAAADGFPERRIVAVFQPHRYTRLRDCWEEFTRAFHHADVVVVVPVYAAGEDPLPGVDHEGIASALRDRGHRGTSAVGSLEAALSDLTARVAPGDVVIMLGAGNVNDLCAPLLTALGAR